MDLRHRRLRPTIRGRNRSPRRSRSRVATNSGTSALELALLGLGIGAGDEVIVPALTFVAPAAAVRSVGAVPVLCDVSEHSWTIDPRCAERSVTRRTKAIVAVDVLGHPCDFDALNALGVPVIEDAAQAHGGVSGTRPCGSFGLLSVFSFYANKVITTGEGGCVATDDDRLASRMRLLANHGMTPDRPYVHDVVGRNFRMTNPTAAIGIGQVERWNELVSARQAVERSYRKQLAGLPVTPRPRLSWATPSCWLFAVSLNNRDRLVQYLRTNEIDARPLWPAVSSLPLYRDSVREPCVLAEWISARTLCLPTWSYMPDTTIEFVCAQLRAFFESTRARVEAVDATPVQ